jgi:hypothetical protein
VQLASKRATIEPAMDAQGKQDFIRWKAQQNQADSEGEKIRWSRHGITELVNEGWNRAMVEEGLQLSEVIEDYPTLHRPLPDCLVLGWLPCGEPFHAVIAVDEINDRLFVVTVYKPSPEEWEHDWRTRKR